MRCAPGDVFGALAAEDVFDLVFWHSNFVLAPPDLGGLTAHDLAYVDPGYRAHRAFLAEAPRRLRQGGSALLGFSSRGDLGRLRELADAADVTLDPVRSRRVAEPDAVVEYQLLRVKPRRAPI